MAQSGFNPGGNLVGQNFASGVGNILSGMFVDQSAPYKAAMGPYGQYMGQAANVQNPFLQAGQGAIGNYQNWLQGMQNPSGFINNLMGQYHQSPWAQYMQQQSMRAGQNAASAAGLTGSSPFAQQLQQNASNISSQDMNNWIQNVLGINTQYGAGEQNLMNQGANAANALTSLYGQEAQGMGNLAAGAAAGQNQNNADILSGWTSFL